MRAIAPSLATSIATLLLAPCLVACTGDPAESPAREESSAPSDPSPTKEEVYRARLERVPGGSTSIQLVISNRGNQGDEYLLRVVPPTAGTVAPEEIGLIAGGEAPVQLTRPFAAALTVEVVSETQDEVLATLELPEG